MFRSFVAFAVLALVVVQCHAVTLSEVCVDVDKQTGESVNIGGRQYTANVRKILGFMCNYADSPYSTNVEKCEAFIKDQTTEDATVILRGEPSTAAAVGSYCNIHKNVFNHHIFYLNAVKELGSWIQFDFHQYVELGECYGMDEASVLVHFNDEGLMDHYQFTGKHEKFYTCLAEVKAAKEKEEL